jgi:hypothetical protein
VDGRSTPISRGIKEGTPEPTLVYNIKERITISMQGGARWWMDATRGGLPGMLEARTDGEEELG